MIRSHGALSRAEIAKDLGISPGTVSTLTAELIDSGYITESSDNPEPGESARGRPPVALSVRPDAFRVAGFKISDRERTGIIVDTAGHQIATFQEERSEMGSAKSEIAAIDAALDTMLGEAGLDRDDIKGIGIGLPGFVDTERGHIHWSPVLPTRNVDFACMASETFGVEVLIDNDANLVALAELWFGIGRDRQDFAVVTIENGVGIGMVVDSRLFRGPQGLGLELAHMKVQIDGALCRCGQRGCLEAYISDYALAREASAALGTLSDEPVPTPELIEKLYGEARSGNTAAQSIFRRAGRYLALGLANTINLFDPSLVIISGDRMRYDYLYSEDILREIETFAIQTSRPMPPVEIHSWGSLLWAHGAAAMALSHVTEAALGAGRDAL